MKVLLVNGNPHKNDSTNRVLEVDGFIFDTPVYYVATRDSMTAFMDRLFYSEFCSNQNKAFSKNTQRLSL